MLAPIARKVDVFFCPGKRFGGRSMKATRTSAIVATVCATSFAGISPSLMAQVSSSANEFITLGTMAGPYPDPERSQPANALILGDDVYLIDAGDGAAGRLVTAGYSMHSLRAIFISHLHFDHIGGLPAILGLRFQTTAPERVTIYGPPGTRQAVDGIYAFMQPFIDTGIATTGGAAQPADRDTEVVEIRDGEILEFDGLTVTAVDNTHLGIPGVEYDRDRYQSLSFRFDLPDRSIVYTGDTGPSGAVEELARGADVLVAEMMDMEWAIENVRRQNPSIPQPVFERVSNHLRTHHLTPLQVGEMATRVGVGKVVVTHFSPGFTDPDVVSGYERQVRAAYDGDVVIANDLDRF